MTYGEVARGVGVSPSYIYRLEKGERNAPSFEITNRIFNFFNLKYKDLLDYIEEEKGDSLFREEVNILEFASHMDIDSEADKEKLLKMVKKYQEKLKEEEAIVEV